MSQSPDAVVEADEASRYASAWDQITRWTEEGRSWSGKERHNFFLNTRDGRFADASSVMGLDFLDDGRGLALTDWDNDGDIDFWTSARTAPRLRFLRNIYAAPGHFLSVQLTGTNCNRDAIGARVSVRFPGEDDYSQVKSLRAGEGYLSQHSKRLHFGLGKHSKPVAVQVDWPDGTKDVFEELAIGTHYLLTQGNVEPRTWSRSEPASALDNAAEHGEQQRHQNAAKPSALLAARYELPDLEFQTGEGTTANLQSTSGQARLVVLWSVSCRPCLTELREFIAHESEIRAAELEVLALSVDGLGPSKVLPSTSEKLLQQMQFPHLSGRATTELLDAFQAANDALFRARRPLTLPSSFLLDASGRLAAIYKGPVRVAHLLEDIRKLPLEGEALLSAVVPVPGRWQNPPRGLRESVQLTTGIQLANQGKWAEALEQFEAAASEIPDNVEVHLQRGRALATLGKLPEAIVALHRAAELAPSFSLVHDMLGDLFMQSGNRREAVLAYQKSLAGDPYNAQVQSKLGVVSAQQGELLTAIRWFQAAADAAPERADLRANLGKALLDTRQYHSAKRELEAALALPQPPLAAELNFAWILAAAPESELRDGQRAVEIADRCSARTNRSNATVFIRLAAAHAEVGAFDQAVETLSQSLVLARNQRDQRLVKELEEQMSLYLGKKPYRLPAAK